MGHEDPDAEIEPAPHVRLLLTHWPGVQREGWRPQVTPGFPLTWPPRGRPPRMAWYGFAYGTAASSRGVVDAVDVGCLWGKVEGPRPGRPGQQLGYSSLSPTIERVGLQGVRPLEPGEIEELDRLPAAERRIGSARFVMLVRPRDVAAYTRWLMANGAAASQLPSIHDRFLDWLNADR